MRSRLLAAVLAAALPLAAPAADSLAPARAKATLEVDYVFESAGRKSTNGGYDPYEWKVKRTVSMKADLVAEPPAAASVLQVGEAQKSAASVEKAMARCGQDQACMIREAQKMAAGMQGSAGSRYQAWTATAQRGTYAIEEKAHGSNTDPICIPKPRHRCTRDETRSGSGEVPAPRGSRGAAGLGAVEVDTGGKTLTLRLPVPLAALPYTETIVSDEPDGTFDTPVPKGPHARQLLFRAGGKDVQAAPVTVPLKGDWRRQSGEYVIDVAGDKGQGGKMVVRWRFSAS